MANPLKPGDLVIPVRTFEGGKMVEGKDENGFPTFTREGAKLVDTPQKGIENTCWRVTEARENAVQVELVKGVFRPHWEPGKEFTSFTDVYEVDASNPFPTDEAAGLFSIFQKVDACP